MNCRLYIEKLGSEDYKILWDFSIQIDPVTEARRTDLLVVDKERSCKLILQVLEIVGLRRRRQIR